MNQIPDASVALVVTSPPYFAGKEYETALGEGHIPKDYVDYLEMLTDVFAECARVLEPGGRIAVNVANLGRKPYRSLGRRRGSHPAGPPRSSAARRDRLAEGARRGRLVRVGLVPERRQPRAPRHDRASGRGEQGALRSSSDPARARTQRAALGRDDLQGRLHGGDDRPVGHPAGERDARRPPGSLPRRTSQRLIELYTYRDDVVIDPFAGRARPRSPRYGASGTSSVTTPTRSTSASGTNAHRTRERLVLEEEREKRNRATGRSSPRPPPLPKRTSPTRRRAVREGQRAKDIAARC